MEDTALGDHTAGSGFTFLKMFDGWRECLKDKEMGRKVVLGSGRKVFTAKDILPERHQEVAPGKTVDLSPQILQVKIWIK